MGADRILAGLVALGVFGCGSADSPARLAELCTSTTNMPAGVCDCMADKAGEDLSSNARAFLIATMEKDADRVTELRGQLTLEEAAQAGMFFASAPLSCVSGE